MIVGNGLLARAFAPRFADDPSVTIFASGVSNSMETRASAFERERRLLEETIAQESRPVVYFGSCGVADKAETLTPYMKHKLAMEALVVASPGGRVLRLPQVVGSTHNPHTLTNYLRDRIIAGEAFAVWGRAERNLIDIEDIYAIATVLLENGPREPAVLSIAAASSTPMPEIVAIFERVLRRRANCTIEDRGQALTIDSRRAVAVAAGLGIDLGSGYAERLIRKYYGPQQCA